MTDHETMKLALDALKNGIRVRAGEGGTKYQPDLEDAAITALEAALSQPEQNKCTRCGEVNPAEIHTCSPQVAQEPVAWITPDGEGFRMRLEPPVNDVPLGWKALYTAPPKREWVGLHLDDIPETFVGDWSFLEGARWAEAKLKEKNGG